MARNAFIYLVRFLRLVLGLTLIGVSVWGLQSQKGLNSQYGEAYELLRDAAADGIATVAADRVDPGYEGKFIHIQGNLDIGQASDPLTGLSLNAERLKRTVEMRQWKEERYTRKGSTEWWSRFEQVWSEDVIDSDGFHQKPVSGEDEHVNPKILPHETGLWFFASRVRLGGWPLNPTYTDHLSELRPVSLELLRSYVGPGWQVNPEGWVTPVNGSSDVGAFRIRYDYWPVKEGLYSAVGLVKDGVLTDNIFGDVVLLPLMAPGEVPAEPLVQATLDHLAKGNPPQNRAGYVFAGLLLCIGVIARFFPFLKGYTEAPFGRRAVITLILAAVGAAAFATLV